MREGCQLAGVASLRQPGDIPVTAVLPSCDTAMQVTGLVWWSD